MENRKELREFCTDMKGNKFFTDEPKIEFETRTNPVTATEFKELNFQIPKRMKYRNVKTEIDGIKFDSKKEAAYYSKLKLLKLSGEVIDFQMQVRYDFKYNGILLCFYKADFVVQWKVSGTKVIDVKGRKLPMYNLKKKMMLAFHGINVIEV